MKVKDIKISKNTTIKKLIEEFKSIGGFQAQHVAKGVEILEKMFKDKCIKFLSFPADIIATGTRGVIIEAIKRKMFDVVITTCGTLDHDIARSFGDYLLGEFEMDDIKLTKRGLFRLGNVIVPKEVYWECERFVHKVLDKVDKEKLSTYEFVWELGKNLPKDSICYWCYKNKIPMIIPGITDGAVGTAVLTYYKKKILIDVWEDERYLSSITFGNKKLGALILGGGISKHHTIWWAQFSGGLKYAVYITSAIEQDGSLSGAKTREAISWGKIKKNANHVNIWGDITIILPLILGYFF